jgi:hypothetical protein
MPIFITSSPGQINHKERKEHKEKAEGASAMGNSAGSSGIARNLPAFSLPFGVDQV